MSAPSWDVWSRMDFNSANVLWYPQRPIVSTDLAQAKGLDDWPMGQNAIIAIALNGGLNEEDAIILNEDSQQRGFMRATVLEVKRAVAKSRGATDVECFEHPLWRGDAGAPKTEGVRGGVNYDTIGVDGLPNIGTRIRDGDVIVGKTMTSTTDLDATGRPRTVCRDRSLVMSCDPSEVYYVDKVAVMPNKEGHRMVRVRLRTSRIMEEGDKACLTPDHEVLVRGRGFISIADVTTDDAIATYDPVSQTMAYVRPTEVFHFDHDGPMYEVSTHDVSLCTTLNHRMWVAPEHTGVWGIMEARDVAGQVVRYRCGGMPSAAPDLMDMNVPGVDLRTEEQRTAFLIVLGTWLGGGWVAPRARASKEYVMFLEIPTLSILTPIMHALDVLGIACKLHERCTLMHIHTSPALAAYMRSLAPGGLLTKRMPAWFFDLSEAQSRVLLEAMLLGDATRFVTTFSAQLRDDVQQLALQAGCASRYDKEAAVAAAADAKQVKWRVAILGSYTPLVVPSRKKAAATERVFHYHGTVHCVSVPPTETFIVRRHGKLVATLNSARHGQKGTIGERRREWDMPFVESGPNAGLRPDKIINLQSIASTCAPPHARVRTGYLHCTHCTAPPQCT